MFRRLRLGLTILYMLAALLLISLIGGGTYISIDRYFQSTTDLALQHKMSHEFGEHGAPVPAELASADRDWYAAWGNPVPQVPGMGDINAPIRSGSADTDDNHNGSEGDSLISSQGADKGMPSQELIPDAYDGELAAIFVLPLSADAQPVSGPNGATIPFSPDKDAVAAAMRQGSDWRTTKLSNGTRLRLLTYRLPQQTNGPAVLQLGRTLNDQDRALNRLLLGLLGLGSASTLFLGIASWWLAGRSIRPAQLAWEHQQSFVANASHELRAPLTLMRAGTEVALRSTPSSDTEQQEVLTDVLQECDHMNRLVEDLLLLSRLDAGRLSLEHEPVKLGELLTDAQRQMGRLAGERGVKVEVNSANGTAIGDPTRLRQVLLILLDNALRYTPSGGSIQLDAQPRGKQVQLTVADTGSGIAPEHLPHIFERFYRADNNRNNETSGSGLGLSIAKKLIEAQHGHIAISSHVGQGTKVTLLLPSGTTQSA